MFKNGYILEGWNSLEHMLNDFSVNPDEVSGYNVVMAIYDQECYEGSAFVLLEKNGDYFEVNGSHCSCNGLEGLWELESTNEEALKHRIEEGYSYGAFNSAREHIKNHFKW